MKQKTVYVDVEGTIADIHKPLCEELKMQNGIEYKVEDITTWGWVGNVITYDKFRQLTDEIWETAPTTVPPVENIENIKDAFRQLSEEYEIKVTTRNIGVEKEMRAWLRHYDLSQYITDFKSAEEYKISHEIISYIDDKPEVYEEFVNVIQYKRPYNGRQEHYNVNINNNLDTGFIEETWKAIPRKVKIQDPDKSNIHQLTL